MVDCKKNVNFVKKEFMKNKIKTVLVTGLLLFVFYANAYSQFLGCGKGCGLFQICPDPGYVIDWVGANVDFKAANNWQNLPMPRHYNLANYVIQQPNSSYYELEWTSTHDYELVVKFIKTWTIDYSITNIGCIGVPPAIGLFTVKEGANKTFSFGGCVIDIDEVLIDGQPIDLNTDPNYMIDPSTGISFYTFYNIQGDHSIEVIFK